MESPFNVPANIVPVLWRVSQIQYGRIDIKEPRRRWANTTGAEMAVEYLYDGKAKRGELMSLEEHLQEVY